MHTAQLARGGKKNVIKGFHGTPGRRPLAVCSATKLTMGVLKCLSLATVFGLTLAAPVEERAAKPKSFLNELGNSTWVIGNDVWNVTQGRQYATKLMYKGKDRVGQAVGHYVSYSKSRPTRDGRNGLLTFRNRRRSI